MTPLPLPGGPPRTAGGALVVRRGPAGARLAVVERAGHVSLPKALAGTSEEPSAAAVRAAREWTGWEVTLGDFAGAARLAAGEEEVVAWFWHATPVRRTADPARSGYRLRWLTPADAAERLGGEEERTLVLRTLVARGRWRRLVRWLEPGPDHALADHASARRASAEIGAVWALATSLLVVLLGGVVGWYDAGPAHAAHAPRFVLFGLLGGWSSAALSAIRRTQVSGGRRELVLRALVGALLALAVLALIGGGALRVPPISARLGLGIAYVSGWLERLALRR